MGFGAGNENDGWLVEVATEVGHGENSQLGPVRPTAEPSGQIFASIVHAVADGRG